MEKRRLCLNNRILIIFLICAILSFALISAEEFKSCSQNSDCKVDSCNENSCMNQSYQIPECVKASLQAKECSCVENICSVSVGSVTPPANTTPVNTTPVPTPTQPTGQPTAQPTKICTDSDNGNFYEKGVMKGAADDAGHTDLCGDYNTLTEYYCENNEAKKTAFNCSNGCKDGACVKGESVSEKVTCIFKNSDREQKCYLSEYNDKFYCSGKDSCVVDVKGYKDEKMIWKSSCGSYIPIIIDGQDENAEFECKVGETTTTQIKNKGFKNVYFQCYDGEESKSTEREACKTADFWKKFASNFCASRCENDPRKCKQNLTESQENIDKCLGKCGVNSFSVTNECYVEETIATPTTPATPVQECKVDSDCPQYKCKEAEEEKCIGASYSCVEGKCKFPEQTESGTSIEPILTCKDSCPLDGKCYQFGYRKGGQFCSDNGGFTEQLKGESTCDNNFECSSNLCIDSQCVSQGLFQKIIDWFGKLFGGK